MFRTRLISGIILLAIALSVVIIGGDLLFGVLIIIAMIGMMELNRVVNVHKSIPGILSYAAAILYYLLIYFQLQQYDIMLVILFLMLLMVAYVFVFPKFKTEQITTAFFGVFYVGVMLSYIYQVRILENGEILVWLIFIGAWGSDTFAYCTGMLFGKHKVAPKLSPKKSIEGCIGGVFGAALLGALFAFILSPWIHDIVNPILVFAIIGAASSVISQVGDLAASAIKRNHEIKDYGTLIPGHGGILDRFDSIIFTAPIVYYLADMVIRHQ